MAAVRRRLAAGVAALALGPVGAAPAAPVDEVDPLIGTGGEGHVFPGAAVPFGFAKPGPDTARPTPSGYRPGEPILGFSQTHVSGVGDGGSMYGNFRLTPLAGRLRLSRLGSRPRRERAAAGLYSVTLPDLGARAEMTATRLVALHRFRFRRGRAAHVLLDATATVGVRGGPRALRSHVRVRGRRGLEGAATFRGGWNDARYKLHFALAFSRPAGRLTVAVRDRRRLAIASFRGSRPVVVKVALSFRGVRQARRRLRHEAPGFRFARVRRAARRAWARAIAPVGVRGGGRAERRALWSALYRAQLMPHDLSGENAWWRSSGPHYEDHFTLWDTFRGQHPLLLLLHPRRERAILRSLIDGFRHTGWLPDARVAGRHGVTQVGSSAPVLLSDARAKGLRGLDWRTALRAVLKDAHVDSPRPLRHGRELRDYLRLGYVPAELGRSASRTLEYAFGDFAAARLSASLGRRAAAARLMRRAGGWALLWDASTAQIRPRRRDGRFVAPFAPDLVQFGFQAPFYEGSARQWSTFVPHDPRGLGARVGGDAAFVRWLALSAWHAWAALGLHPSPGQGWYYLHPPRFRAVRVGRLRIVRRGRGRYVQGATLRGRPLGRAWLRHREVVRGRTLVLSMGARPSRWGRAQPPPSL